MDTAVRRLTRWRDGSHAVPIGYAAGNASFAYDVAQALAEIERLRAALEKVRYKAGSHTVQEGSVNEDDPSFGGIFAVANNALKLSQ